MRSFFSLAGGAVALALTTFAAPVQAGADLNAIIEQRSDEDKARDGFRNPKETLKFFGLKSDMTVVEALPGGGWYTRIILPYVAEKGRYMGVNYRAEMFKELFPNMSEERLARFTTFSDTFPARAAEFVEGDPEIVAYNFGDAPDAAKGTVDMAFFIRALHNLNRVDGPYIDQALTETYELLKPGGIVGVVQHRAPEGNPDDWANGSAGYLKQSMVIAKFEAAGFELVDQSEINANPKDKPTTDDIVWRLPPSNRGPEEDREKNKAIGESDRMTLKFRKPE